MAEGLCFLFQRSLFTFFQVGFFKLLQLETDIVFILPALFGLCDKVFEIPAHLPVVLESLLISTELSVVLCKNIQNIHLKTFLVEQEILMLAVHVDELFSQQFHLRQRSRCIVNEGAALSIGRNFSSQNTFFRIVFDVVFQKELFHTVRSNAEPGFDNAFRSSVLDGFYVSSLSQQQADSTQDDGFSRTGFTGYHGETGRETDVQLVDQCIVLNVNGL